MANGYNSAHQRAEQFKPINFFNLCVNQLVQFITASKRQAVKSLITPQLLYIAPIQVNAVLKSASNCGGYRYA